MVNNWFIYDIKNISIWVNSESNSDFGPKKNNWVFFKSAKLKNVNFYYISGIIANGGYLKKWKNFSYYLYYG